MKARSAILTGVLVVGTGCAVGVPMATAQTTTPRAPMTTTAHRSAAPLSHPQAPTFVQGAPTPGAPPTTAPVAPAAVTPTPITAPTVASAPTAAPAQAQAPPSGPTPTYPWVYTLTAAPTPTNPPQTPTTVTASVVHWTMERPGTPTPIPRGYQGTATQANAIYAQMEGLIGKPAPTGSGDVVTAVTPVTTETAATHAP